MSTQKIKDILSEPSSTNEKKELKKAQKKLKAEKFQKKQNNPNSLQKIPNPQKTRVIEKIEYTSSTLSGQKKDTSCPLPTTYSSLYVEAAWYSWWTKQGFFKPEYKYTIEQLKQLPAEQKFIILIPPPNVTGTLHIGHALMCSIEDVLARWNRMHGKAVLWNPGCDHAGIATQVVVEKKLKREIGASRHDMGREKFIEEVWKWKNEKGVVICDQMKRLGISVDWSKEYFTMDEKRSTAVIESFVKLYEQGLIYRAKRLVNWSCSLKSAISDIEVEKHEIASRTYLSVPGYTEKIEFGVLVYFAYKFEDSEDTIIVATTRIESMLGDVAVAVHPDDPRYKDKIGKYLLHPFCHRRLLIISDSAVDPNFGTGAVKITPAHDQTDYEIGIRHKLEMINIYDDEGKIVSGLSFKEEFKHFEGLKRFDVRKIVLKYLTELNIFIKKTDHSYVLPICSRSKDIIEPLLKSQWFVSCSEMARKAVEVVKNGKLKISPSHHEKVWFMWMENIRDWCISRQLWWGHRIPAYHVTSSNPILANSHHDDPKYWICARNIEEARQIASKKYSLKPNEINLTQDEDVLDTWYSSGILPFSIFEWPSVNSEFDAFYPNSLLETGYDILFFWVARMVMLSQQLTGQLPFKEILLHSIIRDSHGRKMSKSLGNIIDPVDVIEGISIDNLNKRLISYNLDPQEVEKARKGQIKDFPNGIPECGTDALRFTLCAYSSSRKDINLDILRVQGYRFFCNKIWNAVRFCLQNFGSDFSPKFTVDHESDIDMWILSRLSYAEDISNESFEKYDFSTATTAIYNFWLYDFCDVYIESVKPILLGKDVRKILISRNVMFTCVDNGLRLLHPFMPYITEELYQRLPFSSEHFEKTPSICISSYPHNLEWRSLLLEREVNTVMSTVSLIRSTKDDYLPTKTKVEIYINCLEDSYYDLFKKYNQTIATLSNALSISFMQNSSEIPPGCAVTTNGNICHIYILLKGVIDISKEVAKTEDRLKKTQESLNKIESLINSTNYSTKVPVSVQEANSQKAINYKDEITKIENMLKCLKIAE